MAAIKIRLDFFLRLGLGFFRVSFNVNLKLVCGLGLGLAISAEKTMSISKLKDSWGEGGVNHSSFLINGR